MLRALTVHFIAALGIALSGCSSLAYYQQAASGQWEVLQARTPIDTLLAAPETPPTLREQLAEIMAIRTFAAEELALPVGGTFSGYADLERNYAVWNVLAAPADSLVLKSWCYPLIGCQTYRGYFDRAQAERTARKLAEEGWDVWLTGVIAYATLGWFDDPVLNTFVHWPEDRLAALVFHELSHKVVYIPGDTAFNESYASAVELAGLRRYLAARGQSEDFARALARQRMAADFTAMVMATAEELRALYQRSDLAPEAQQQAKQQLLDELRQTYRRTRKHWPEPDAYRAFFDEGLNNARIASVGTYHRWVPAFRQLLREVDGDFSAFHARVADLAEYCKVERTERLEALARRTDGSDDEVLSPTKP